MFDKQALCHAVFPRRCAAAAFLPCCLAMLALLACPARAQQQQSRLEQYEATYQANLRAIHAPILQDYLRALENLRTTLTNRNRVADAKQVEAEIARVKNIVNTTGILPPTELQAALGATAEAAPPVATPAPAAPAKPAAGPLPVLLAAEAKGAALDAKTGAGPLGTAEWHINRLPAGTYDLLVMFASGPLVLPEHVTVNIGGQDFKSSVASDRATGSPETFRLLRLCQVKLEAEVTNSPLTITAASKANPLLWVKRVMFATPKKPATAAPPTPAPAAL
jgi:hypothetical protein